MSWRSAILHANTRKKVAMHTASTFNLSHLHSQSKSFTPSLSCQCYSLVLALYFRSWLCCLQPLWKMYKCAHLKFTVTPAVSKNLYIHQIKFACRYLLLDFGIFLCWSKVCCPNTLLYHCHSLVIHEGDSWSKDHCHLLHNQRRELET